MCLGIPARIEKVEKDYAQANIGGAMIKIGIQLLDNVQTGDYVIVHTGFALEKISEEEALYTLKLLQQMKDLDAREDISHEI